MIFKNVIKEDISKLWPQSGKEGTLLKDGGRQAELQDQSQQLTSLTFFFFFPAIPMARGNSQAKDQTHTTVITQTAAVTMPDP